MKKYITPEIEIIDLDHTDIIATSPYPKMDISDTDTFDDIDFIG